MNKDAFKRWLTGSSAIGRILRWVIVVYMVLVFFAHFVWDSMIFVPQASSYVDGPEIIKIEVEDATYISAVYLDNPVSKFTILYSHGNAEDIGDVRPILERLERRGFSVFAYDYRGYGTSDGKPSETNTYRDIEASYDYLVKDLKVPADRIIVMGRSVGGGPAVELALHRQTAGLICESCFVSVFRVMTRIRLLCFDKFNNIAKIKKLGCPVLIIHGTDDRIIPAWHGRKLFEAAGEPRFCLWVEGAGHNDDIAEIAGESYWQKINSLTEAVSDKMK